MKEYKKRHKIFTYYVLSAFYNNDLLYSPFSDIFFIFFPHVVAFRKNLLPTAVASYKKSGQSRYLKKI